MNLDPNHPYEYLRDCAERLNNGKSIYDSLCKALDNSEEHALEVALERLKNHREDHYQVVGRYCLWLRQELEDEDVLCFKVANKLGGLSKYVFHRDRLLPYNVKEECEKPGYVVTIPYLLSSNSEADQKNIRKMVKKIHDESFGKIAKVSHQKCDLSLRVVIGANRLKSVDSQINALARNTIDGCVLLENMDVALTGFFWKVQWQKAGDNVKIKAVRAHYELLKKLDSDLASLWLKHNERPEFFSDIIPYQYIRERVKDLEEVTEAVQSLRAYNPLRQVYMALLDPDFVTLRTDQRGLYSHYNRLYKQHKVAWDEAPTIASTGYRAPKESGDFFTIGIKLDQAVREATGKIFANGIYIPEPNMIVAFEEGEEIIRETFIKKNTQKLESRILISNILKDRGLVPEVAIAFQTLGAIKTTIPDRFITDKNENIGVIKVGDVGKKKILKTLRNIPQSHINPLWGWAKNLSNALSKRNSTIDGHVANIFNQFNPISVALSIEGDYNKSQFRDALNVHHIYVDYMFKAYEFFYNEPDKRDAFMEQEEVLEIIDEVVDAQLRFYNIKNPSQELIQDGIDHYTAHIELLISSCIELLECGITEDEVWNVVLAACDSGKAMVEVFNSIK